MKPHDEEFDSLDKRNNSNNDWLREEISILEPGEFDENITLKKSVSSSGNNTTGNSSNSKSSSGSNDRSNNFNGSPSNVVSGSNNTKSANDSQNLIVGFCKNIEVSWFFSFCLMSKPKFDPGPISTLLKNQYCTWLLQLPVSSSFTMSKLSSSFD
ncbi:hypothetical protein ACTFIR_003796 [Dictyostelium discoideum]